MTSTLHPPLPGSHRDIWRRRRQAMEADGGRFTRTGRRPRSGLDYLISLALACRMGGLPVLRRGRRNALAPILRRLELAFPDLPAGFDGFTILHLSDLHPSCLDGVMAAAARLVEGMEVDLAVVTGDFQERGQPSAHDTAQAVRPLLSAYRARHGTFATLGNHDTHDMADALTAHGVTVLINEHAVIERQGRRLVLAGTDDVERFFTEAAVHTLTRRPEGFTVALVHSPDLAAIARRAGINLYLTGHTHGGQICLPGATPIVTATDAPRRLAAGCWQLGNMRGHTSRGVGVGLPAVRYNCPGEIVRITLRQG